MAIFIDVFYPGNSKRSKRVSELTDDCHHLFVEAATAKEEIETKLNNCNEIIKKTYEQLAKTPPSIKEVSEINELPIYVSEVLTDIFASTAAISALRWAIANYFVKVGQITAEELARVGANNALKILMPKWLKIGSEAGVMIVVTVAVDMIVDSISGAVERDNLRKAIKEAAVTRLGCKVADMYNNNLKETLDAVIIACDAFIDTPLPPETLDIIIQSIVDKHKISENAISREAAITSLEEFDKTRNSWTEEDGDWKHSKTPLLKSTPRFNNYSNERIFTAVNGCPNLSPDMRTQFLRSVERKYEGV